jgi:hypothetical protein
MSVSLESVAAKYLTTKKLSSGTCKEYRGTVAKWTSWGKGVDVDQIGRVHLRDFIDWVLAVLSPRQDEEAVLSTDEPRRADAPQEPQGR